jgi:hypothetical protein
VSQRIGFVKPKSLAQLAMQNYTNSELSNGNLEPDHERHQPERYMNTTPQSNSSQERSALLGAAGRY